MDNKDKVILTCILIIIGLIIWSALANVKQQQDKMEFQDFILFQVEYSKFLTDKCDLNYTAELDNFFEYKVEEIRKGLN